MSRSSRVRPMQGTRQIRDTEEPRDTSSPVGYAALSSLSRSSQVRPMQDTRQVRDAGKPRDTSEPARMLGANKMAMSDRNHASSGTAALLMAIIVQGHYPHVDRRFMISRCVGSFPFHFHAHFPPTKGEGASTVRSGPRPGGPQTLRGPPRAGLSSIRFLVPQRTVPRSA